MGSPAMNLVPAKVVVTDGSPHAQLGGAGEHDLPAPLQPGQSRAHGEGRDILLGIRPEAITDPDGADRKSANIVLAVEARSR